MRGICTEYYMCFLFKYVVEFSAITFDDQAALAMRGCGFPDYNILVKGTSCKQRGVWGPVYTCGSG